MKRFFNDEGEITSAADLVEAEKLIHQAFDKFVKAGYLHRDFFQFADLESSLCVYDFELDRALGENQ